MNKHPDIVDFDLLQCRAAALEQLLEVQEETIVEQSQRLDGILAELQCEREALLESEARIRSIIEAALDAVISIDTDGVILEWNAQAQKTLGWSRDEAVGQSLASLIVPFRHRQAHECGMRRYLATGEGPILNKRIELTAIDREGREFPIELSVVPVRTGGNTMFSAFLREITERKQAEAELAKARDEALTASRLKSEFLANMSHEIRTPMNGVMGMTELVLETDLNPEQRDYLNAVKSSADSMLSVINDILDFSKIEAGRLELDPVSFNLRDLIEDTARALALRAHEKGLELICNVLPEVPEYVVGDTTRTRQVLVNLLGNAIKFTQQGEVELEVALQFQKAGQLRLQFSVRDTGIGIPQGKQKMIFDAFSQADGTTTRKYGGTGLGLTISARLVEAMQGEIWVESTPAKGSCFHFTASLGVSSETRDIANLAEAVPLAGVRVVVVDDNLTNRRILADMLWGWGMLPAPAASGPEALAHMRRGVQRGQPYSLVLTDVHMPDMDGFELVKRIHDSPELTKAVILMLTSGDRGDDIARCRKLGVSSYLTKPVRRAELRAAIATAIASQGPLGGRAVPLVGASNLTPRSYSGSKLHILLAEDNAVNQRVALRILEKAGHSVAIAKNGRVALRMLEEQVFDLILMDVQMPEMDGLEAARHIREEEKHTGQHIPIVAMTAHALAGDRERCLQGGMDNYIAKPITAAALLEIVALYGGRPVAIPESSLIREALR